MMLANILSRSCPEIECRGPREVSCGKSFVGRRAGSKTNPGEDARGITVNSWIGGGGESAVGVSKYGAVAIASPNRCLEAWTENRQTRFGLQPRDETGKTLTLR